MESKKYSLLHTVSHPFPISPKMFGQNIVLSNIIRKSNHKNKIVLMYDVMSDYDRAFQEELTKLLKKEVVETYFLTKYNGKKVSHQNVFKLAKQMEKSGEVYLLYHYMEGIKALGKSDYKKALIFFHSPPEVYGINEKNKEHYYRIFEKAKAYVAVSENVRKKYSNLSVVDNKKAFYVLNNSVDLELYNTSIKERADLNPFVEIYKNYKVVLYVGRISLVKGSPLLLRVINKIIKKDKDVVFLIVSPPFSNFQNFLTVLNEIAKENKEIHKRVYFGIDLYKFSPFFGKRENIEQELLDLLSKPLFHKQHSFLELYTINNVFPHHIFKKINEGFMLYPFIQVPSHLYGDVLLHPSIYEAFGLSQLEAIALSKPVVALETEGSVLLKEQFPSLMNIVNYEGNKRELYFMKFGINVDNKKIDHFLESLIDRLLSLLDKKQEFETKIEVLSIDSLAKQFDNLLYNLESAEKYHG